MPLLYGNQIPVHPLDHIHGQHPENIEKLTVQVMPDDEVEAAGRHYSNPISILPSSIVIGLSSPLLFGFWVFLACIEIGRQGAGQPDQQVKHDVNGRIRTVAAAALLKHEQPENE